MAKVVDLFSKQEVEPKVDYKKELAIMAKGSMNIINYLSVMKIYGMSIAEEICEVSKIFDELPENKKKEEIIKLKRKYEILTDANTPDHRAVTDALIGKEAYIKDDELRNIVKERKGIGK